MITRRLLLLGVPLGALGLWCGSQAGYWLSVNDFLEPTDAILVLGGDPPFRAIEAARLYKDRLAPEIWLLPEQVLGEREYARIGVEPCRENQVNREVVVKLGVPEAAVRTLAEGASDTYTEVDAACRELERRRLTRLIIATSRQHTRRVRLIADKLARPGQRILVRGTRDDHFQPSRWWATTTDMMSVAREVFGIANAWLGFPVRTKYRSQPE